MGAQINDVVEHLFRQESGKLSASLTRAFRLSKLGEVEDIVQDTLLAALTVWLFRGVPENPTAWLHRVAKNKAVDYIRKRQHGPEESIELLPGMLAATASLEIERNFLDWEVDDSQLRMMFACCHPGLPVESQIALTLKSLCGFSVREIASAFLAQEATIEKRLGRARKYFREHHVELEVPSASAVHARVHTVLHCLYLLFNEGYKRTDSADDRSPTEGLVQRDLCLEAMRLVLLVTEHPEIQSPEAFALLALMSFLAARFDARTDALGNIVLLSEQDRSKWNRDLIERGFHFLSRSQFDSLASTYQIEAGIQALHVSAPSFAETNWAAILGLYKQLFALAPNPIVALHTSVSMLEVHGPEAAIELLAQHPLPDYYLYHALLADAQAKAGRQAEARDSYRRAIELTMNEKEKTLLIERLHTLE